MLKSFVSMSSMLDKSPNDPNSTMKRAIRILRLANSQRTEEETQYLSDFLKNFEIFRNKPESPLLNDSLRQAAFTVKYIKLQPGQFLYHLDQLSDSVYLILKGEAWRFRAKTIEEFRLEGRVINNQANPTQTPKILETIRLAQASKNREKGNIFANQNALVLNNEVLKTEPVQKKIIKPKVNCLTIEEKKSSEASRHTPNRTPRDSPNKKKRPAASTSAERNISASTTQTSLKNSVMSKLKQNKDVINFENNYLASLVKRNIELNTRYNSDGIISIKFDQKYAEYDCLGETAMNLNHPRSESVLAYSELHVLVLNQKGYEQVFANQIKGMQDRINYFLDFFTEMRPDWLKRLCFLFEEKTFHIDEVIYREKDQSKCVYFIKSGEIHLSKFSSTGPKEKNEGSLSARPFTNKLKPRKKKSPGNLIVTSLGEGQFFGEEFLFHKHEREYTAKSKANSVLYMIPNEILHKLPSMMIEKLMKLSQTKSTWRGEYVTELKTKPDPHISTETFLTEQSTKKVPSTDYLLSVKQTSSSKLAAILKPYQGQTSTAPNSYRKPKGKSNEVKKIDIRKYRFKFGGKNEREESNEYSRQLEKDMSGITTSDMRLSIWKRNVSPKENRIFPSGRTSVEPLPPSNSRVYDEDRPEGPVTSRSKYEDKHDRNLSSRSKRTDNESFGSEYQMPNLKHSLMKKFQKHVIKQAYERNTQISPTATSGSFTKRMDNQLISPCNTLANDETEKINVQVRHFLEQVSHDDSGSITKDSMRSSNLSPKTPQFNKRSNLLQQTFNMNPSFQHTFAANNKSTTQPYGFFIPIPNSRGA